MKLDLRKLSLSLLALSLLAGCAPEKPIEVLPKQELFSLALGKMENQIDLFQITGVPSQTRNRVFMKGSMIYIANGNSSKLMKFTSYGDLLFLLYNPDTNPEPLLLKEAEDDGMVINRFASRYNLRNTGEVAVDNQDNIYLEDEVADDKRFWDEKLQVSLSSQILKFNRKGQLVDTLGREGSGPSLFPYISSLYLNAADELTVICRVPSAWLVYRFSAEGRPLDILSLSDDMLPSEKDYIPAIEKIIPAYSGGKSFIQATYYHEVLDAATNTKINIENVYSRVYTYNPATAEFENYIRVPDAGLSRYYTNSGEVEIPAPSFELLGVTRQEYYFFIRPDEEARYQLLVLNSAGRNFANRYILIDDTELYFEEMEITENGLIYALLCKEKQAELVWWRSDKLIGALSE